MKYFYNRRLFISILFILLVVCTTILPSNDFPKFISDERTPSLQVEGRVPSLQLFEGNFVDTSIMLPRTQYNLKCNVNSNSNNIFGIYETPKFVLALQLALQVSVIDRRKQIIALIIRHFEGGKYKGSLSFL